MTLCMFYVENPEKNQILAIYHPSLKIFQTFLTNFKLFLKENKYCADCKAKSPRWASWNLGVFMCIRCSGTVLAFFFKFFKVPQRT